MIIIIPLSDPRNSTWRACQAVLRGYEPRSGHKTNLNPLSSQSATMHLDSTKKATESAN